jgi:ABC-type nitrate/sulfonate/bicarbonate transport system substrate-binding protein
MTRALLSFAIACSCACSLASTREPNGGADDALVKVDVCNSALSASQALPTYAQDTGLFRRYGLDVNQVVVAGGSRAVAALTSGSVQLCVVAGGPVANAVAAGANLVVIGSLLDTYAYSFVVSKSIQRPADLRGKAVAVSTPGSASATAMDIALGQLALRPGVDVTVLALGDYPQRLAALDAGYVAGTVVDYPELVQAHLKGWRTLLDLAPLNLPALQIALVTERTFLTNHRSTVIRFAQALTHAMLAVRRDERGASAALAKFVSLDPVRDREVLTRTFEAVYAGRLKRTLAIPMDAVQSAIDEAARNHPDVPRLTPESFVDMTVVEELEDRGFLKSLEQ